MVYPANMRSAAESAIELGLADSRSDTIGEICRMMEISKPTLYNYLAEASA